MKKITFLVMSILLITMGTNAQNLIENPGFESWTGDQPDVWTTDGGAITLSQNTANVQEGSASCQVIFTSDENQNLLSNSFAVSAGDPVAVSLYVYDNDIDGRARLTILFDAGGNYYGDEYSEDMDAWQLLSYEGTVPDGATEATFQIRFYDVGDWDGDAEILVDNTSFIIDNAIKPEPSNYPTDFAASPNGTAANISWTDATGDQLPQKYLVMASLANDFVAPVDGIMVDDDNDMSDGSAVMNIAFGQESTAFGGLSAAQTYYFTIYPYTNAGADIDYKTDGMAPSIELTMPDVSILNFEDFEDNGLGDWEAYNVSGDQVWEIAPYGNPGNCAKMSGYVDGSTYANEDWLISPAFNFDNYTEETFAFENATKYDGPVMELLISTDYASGDPSLATWESIDFAVSPGEWEWTPSGEIDLSDYNGTVHLAYKFTCTAGTSPTWEVDNILLTGTMSNDLDEIAAEKLKVYPNPGSGWYHISNIKQTELNISVYTILGELIYENTSSESLIHLNIQNEDNGVYLVQMIGNNVNETISIVKR